MRKVNNSVSVIERWEEQECLRGISEDDKKYLADLYDALYDKLKDMDEKEVKQMVRMLCLEELGILSGENDNDVKDTLLELLLPVVRRVYECNRTVSMVSFLYCLSRVYVNTEFLNDNLGDDARVKLSKADRLRNYLVEKMNDCTNKE